MTPPATPRVLVAGSWTGSRRAGSNHTYVLSLGASPTLHDYGMVLCRYSNETFHKIQPAKWKEWATFTRLGGIGIVTDVDESIQRYLDRLIGQNLQLNKLVGRQIHWTPGTYLYEVLKGRLCERWLCVLPRSEESRVRVLGRNEAGDPVAFEIGFGRGRVVLLPRFTVEEREILIPALIQVGLAASAQARSSASVPEWATAVPLQAENRLRGEKERLETLLSRLSVAKSILSAEGRELSRECHRILNEILSSEGFDVRYVEEGGAHDIEIIGSNLTVVVEVKASSDAAKIGAARQLMDHTHQFPAKTQRVTGLLVCNAYRGLPPRERPPAFSPTCLRLLDRQHYCAMTTTQLLDLYDEFMRGDLVSGSLVQALEASSGVLSRPNPVWASASKLQ